LCKDGGKACNLGETLERGVFMNDVLICGEITDSSLHPGSLEILGIGKKLASDLGVGLSAVIMGDRLCEIAEQIVSFGADKIYKIESPLLDTFKPDLWVEILEDLIRRINPKVLLMLHSYTSMEVAPRLACRLKTELTTDCIALAIDRKDGLLMRTKPVYGGNVVAVFKHKGEPQFVTVRRKVMKPAERASTKGEIIKIAPEIGKSVVKIESMKIVKEETVELDKADVIIAGGRGIGGLEGLKELEDMADSLKKSFDNVMIGCSRPVVDSGWMPSNRQIGLTGETVSPDLFIAVGISGAIQHLVGMIRSKKIIAINNDPNSNIFWVADYGVVDDFEKVIPAFRKKWEELA